MVEGARATRCQGDKYAYTVGMLDIDMIHDTKSDTKTKAMRMFSTRFTNNLP